MKQPIYYMQTDPLWKDKPYRAPGESSTIGSAGCGPSCAAMLIHTITGKVVTPEMTCKWSMEHGGKALRQGTYYSYFKPQFAAYDIEAYQFNYDNLYHCPNNKTHDKALALLNQGYYLIALMKKGNWTSGGHFIVVYDVKDGKVLINDPYSQKPQRIRGDLNTFKNECAYYFAVNAAGYEKKKKEEEEVTQEDFNKMLEVALGRKAQTQPGTWSKEAREYCIKNGIFKGDGKGNYDWGKLISREECAQLIYQASKSAPTSK